MTDPNAKGFRQTDPKTLRFVLAKSPAGWGWPPNPDGAPPPGFFWLLPLASLSAIFVNKPCVILAASWWVSGEGQCRD